MMQTSVGIKRKRTQNTNSDQYVLYLEALENDYILRSGTVDPTVAPDYIDKKWDELTLKLNSIGNGPALTRQNWQKRFKDWKNSTRAKYRKIVEARNTTGGGVIEVTTELTPLEERGLQLWGKVAVTGTPLVTVTGGIHPPKTKSEETDNHDLIANSQVNENCNETETITLIPIEHEDKNEENLSNRCRNPEKKKKFNKKMMSLNESAEQLKRSYDQNTEVLRDISNSLQGYVEAYQRACRNEERRLNFDIQKYQFENQGFEYVEDNS